jgi:glucose/arabinose dehydrogenase
MVDPVHHHDYSSALSGMLFYTGDAFPEWRGNVFVGAMTPRFLSRLIVEPGRRVLEERLLLERRWRVRVIQQGPDGFIYLGIERSRRDTSDGMIVRLRPL